MLSHLLYYFSGLKQTLNFKKQLFEKPNNFYSYYVIIFFNVLVCKCMCLNDFGLFREDV